MLLDEISDLVEQAGWRLDAELRKQDGPRAEGAAAPWAVATSHGVKEGRALLPFLAIPFGVRQATVDEGQIIEEAPPDILFTSPKHERTKLFLSKVLQL